MLDRDRGARGRGHGRSNITGSRFRPRAATATGDQRINSFGIGGEIEVRTGLHAQKQVIAAPVVHFGLGEATRAEVARITGRTTCCSRSSTSGGHAVARESATERVVSVAVRLERAGDGFVTDFIWRSPLGLRINAQATADVLMTEDWSGPRRSARAARRA